jgi:hypothetical protein
MPPGAGGAPAAVRLVAQDSELDAIRMLRSRKDVAAAALVLVAEPGIGKTSIWEAASLWPSIMATGAHAGPRSALRYVDTVKGSSRQPSLAPHGADGHSGGRRHRAPRTVLAAWQLHNPLLVAGGRGLRDTTTSTLTPLPFAVKGTCVALTPS